MAPSIGVLVDDRAVVLVASVCRYGKVCASALRVSGARAFTGECDQVAPGRRPWMAPGGSQ